MSACAIVILFSNQDCKLAHCVRSLRVMPSKLPHPHLRCCLALGTSPSRIMLTCGAFSSQTLEIHSISLITFDHASSGIVRSASNERRGHRIMHTMQRRYHVGVVSRYRMCEPRSSKSKSSRCIRDHDQLKVMSAILALLTLRRLASLLLLGCHCSIPHLDVVLIATVSSVRVRTTSTLSRGCSRLL